MINTIRKVTMVVPVLITSCQVSEKSNIGPDRAHINTTAKAIRNDADEPVQAVTLVARFSKAPLMFCFITNSRFYNGVRNLCQVLTGAIQLDQKTIIFPKELIPNGFPKGEASHQSMMLTLEWRISICCCEKAVSSENFSPFQYGISNSSKITS